MNALELKSMASITEFSVYRGEVFYWIMWFRRLFGFI